MNFSNKPKTELLRKCRTLLIVCITYYLVTWRTGCPIRFLTGISCPGCGITRAWLAFLHRNIAEAFYYHPLFLLAPLFIVLFLFEDQVDVPKYRWLIYAVAGSFLVVYLLRLIWFPNEIVVCRPQEGILCKILQRLLFSFSQ